MCINNYGTTSIEKFPNISASDQNFLDPLPPLQKGPDQQNVGISYLKVIIKFFFSKFQTPLFNLNLTDFINWGGP